MMLLAYCGSCRSEQDTRNLVDGTCLDCRADALCSLDRSELVRLKKRRDDALARKPWIQLGSIDRQASAVQRRMYQKLYRLDTKQAPRLFARQGQLIKAEVEGPLLITRR